MLPAATLCFQQTADIASAASAARFFQGGSAECRTKRAECPRSPRTGPYQIRQVAMEVTPAGFLKCRHENSTKETNMTAQFKTKRNSQALFLVLIAVCLGATPAAVHAQKPEAMKEIG